MPPRTVNSSLASLFDSFAESPIPPFLPGTGSNGGTIAFDYGARTKRLLPEIDETEGTMVVEPQARRLPPGAVV